MDISQKHKIISLYLKAVVIISAVVGVILSAVAAKGIFMGGGRVFMYFTIQSNIAVALVELIGFMIILHNKSVGNAWFIIKLVSTVSITLTGAVFTFILAPTLGSLAWNAQNVLTHVVVPVVAVADFFVTGIYGEIKKRHVFFVVLPPFVYAIYAGVGYVLGWEFSEGANYPYFFLNWGSPAGAFGFSNELPFMGCVWWIIVLLALLLAVGFGYLALIEKIKKKRRQAKLK